MKRKMKTYKDLFLFPLFLFLLIDTSLFAQITPSQNKGLGSIALVFPIQVSNLPDFDPLGQENLDSIMILEFIQDRLSDPQYYENKPSPSEANSLSRLMEETLRLRTTSEELIAIDIETLKNWNWNRIIQEKSALFQEGSLKKSDAVLFMMYTIEDSNMQLASFLLKNTGESYAFLSNRFSVFDLLDAARKTVDSFIEKGALVAKKSTPVQSELSIEEIELPSIDPWKNRDNYKKAQSAFETSMGGAAISLSISFVAVGLWNIYREAAYRNSAFDVAATISAIAAGTSAAVTATFLTISIWNAGKMLGASH